MLEVLNYSEARKNLRQVLENVEEKERVVIITRKSGGKAVVISLERLNELEKAERNLRYLQMLDRSIESLESGGIVLKSMEDVKGLEEGK
ncbi:MAG: type II toxin-antitoxin system Phd/YefM family antitoxin [Planctomycetia bacterium]|nr:type II toxin-antitoxin system Phd/YefM family antitoxin [Planctomycetia bacterium]